MTGAGGLVALAVGALVCSCASPRDPLAGLISELRADPEHDLRGVIVIVDGAVVREEYFNGATADEMHDMRSAGKSVTSLLVGIAIDRGLVAGVDLPLGASVGLTWSDERAAITLEDALTMRSGLAADDRDPASPGNEDKLDQSTDWLALAGSIPLRTPPGKTYVYNSLTAFLVGALVEKAAGEGLQEFAARHLFAPLGIRDFQWRRGPRGEGAGQGSLRLRLRDMAALGEMVLGRGIYRGRRVVSEAWIDASLAARVEISAVDPYADHYGYMWYQRTHQVGGAPVLVHFASGNGGNKI